MLLIAGVIGAIVVLVGQHVMSSPSFGGYVTTITNPYLFKKGVTLTGDSTTGGKTLTVTSSNTATSTATAGCFQGYATSTATPLHLTFSPFAGTTTTDGTNSNFLVAARYGACPNL